MWEPVKYLLAGIGGIAAFSLFAQCLTWNVLLDHEKMEADAKAWERQKREMEQYRVRTLDDAGGPCEFWGQNSPQCADGQLD
jgi:hypothetical protein